MLESSVFLRGSVLDGKKGVVMGVANDKSICWGIAEAVHAQGGALCFTYQGEALQKRIEPLAHSLNSAPIVLCDVSNPSAIDDAFEAAFKALGRLDFVVHGIAFSDKNELKGRYVDTTVENFLNTMNISCYSFVAAARSASRFMSDGGSILTLTYYGAEKVIPNYNTMGVAKAALEASVRYIANDLGKNNIRVNGISSGPIRTLAASGIGGFKDSLHWNQENAPLRRNTTLQDVGHSAVYLLSDLSSGVTGEIIHVDSGYHAIGMKMHQFQENDA
ncbi:SDR family oxidoreductase [Rickettsiales endosymbiont of Peranema trichophorum]|uniref:enoyl-ACP reductase FabI n=1 Tax=Rickettsiales endosymbiont of Peranema trichophorum TaxID=2486577 RepID=UPI00102351CA|nr:SDR family oxidoreductase [Rickettsiales endosymbiont of Peranema trichophorum]RZI47663.1 SDR family oxidoreductase [Rickettsiales endosymbiont of Peranema trichophorum]